MKRSNLKSVDSHFAFGANWRDYAAQVGAQAEAEAEAGLRKLFPQAALRGARFLDIGCGSGIHSLAALRCGVDQLTAIDIDPDSVETARALLESRTGRQQDVRQLSIFEARPEELGLFDVVYSWGVLHHTGAMWEAVDAATRFVRPGGLFGLALYERRPSCGFWRVEKRLYAKAPVPVQAIVAWLYKALFYTGLVVTGRRPANYLSAYRLKRGMSFSHDVHDWLGGYPYESASVEEVRSFMRDRGFEIVGLHQTKEGIRPLGTGCAEYSLLHVAQPDGAR
jgi:SAM-dependent methyltransferase